MSKKDSGRSDQPIKDVDGYLIIGFPDDDLHRMAKFFTTYTDDKGRHHRTPDEWRDHVNRMKHLVNKYEQSVTMALELTRDE